MRVIEQSLSAGEEMELGGGLYFHIIGATDPVDITFFKQSNTPTDTAIGVGEGYRSIRSEQDRSHGVKIKSATAQKIKVAHSEHYGDYNVIVGNVNALTEQKNLSKNGNQFIGGYHLYSSTQKVALGLYNPPGSGVVLLVDQIIVNAEGSSVTLGGMSGVMMTSGLDLTQYNLAGGNKNQSLSAASKGQLYQDLSGGAVVNLPIYGVYPTEIYGTPSQLDYKTSPFVINEGKGLVVQTGVINKNLYCTIGWSES